MQVPRHGYLIGVDLGTSSTKAALYRPDGRLVAEASADVPLYYPKPGVVEQKNDDFYQSAARTVGECIGASGIEPRDVAAIAFDSQMAGVGSVDEDFQPATRYDSWLDMRCQPYIEHLESSHGDVVTRISGCPPTCDHGPKILWWKEERPQEYARIAKFLMPAAYVAGTMAGLKGDEAFIDYTFIHFSALSDARAGTWSDRLCGLLGVDQEKLPRIVAPWEVIGEVTEAAARDFGLAPGTPIAAGCGDTAAGALGAGIVQPGMLLDTAGTASVLAGCSDRFVADEDNRALLTMRSVVPGLWNPLAYIAGGGQALRWFRDEFFHAEEPLEGDLYEVMTKRAGDAPAGADGLFFSPHLGGRVCPAEPAMRGAWVGFSWGHTQDHFFRAVLESIAFEYAYYLRILRRLIPDLSLIEARVIGGGSKSMVWNQIKADVLGVPYQRLERSEFATWGGAMIAGRAVGVFDDLAETAMATTAPKGEPVSPQPEGTKEYRQLADRYIGWEATLAEAFRSLVGYRLG
ncbi:MAG: FGGY family carbohydrate kinase [Anaerolineae bacterium]|jgi:xylulokinase